MRHAAGLWLFAAAATFAVALLHAQQPRDGRAPAPGTASLSGVVVTADATAAPVRRAIVEVGGVAMLTDDEGRYAFNRLPAGTYFVLATKAGFLPASFGSRRPAGPGVGVDVRDGQQMTGVRLKLFRGSVLTGMVVDQFSRPAAGTEVRAFRDGIDPTTGQSLPLPVTIGLGETITDDKGRYRLFGLEPGDYIVSAAGAAAGDAVRTTTDEDVRYALQLLKSQPGVPADPSVRRPPPVSSPRTGAGAPMYYSSAESAGEAARITLGIAEERQGVDVVRRRVSEGIVKGNVSGSFAAIRDGGKVYIIDVASPFTDSLPWDQRLGSFVFTGVPPGHYEVVALSENGGFRGRSEAFVAGSETALSIVLQPGVTVAGRLAFQSTTGQAADPAVVRLSLMGTSRADLLYRTSPVKPDGSFVWTGVPAGSYRLAVSTASNIQPGWRAKSAMVGGVDLLDGALDLTGGAPGDIVINLSDARSAITGTLQALDGAPISDYSVLAFSAENTFWRPMSRRTQIVRPNSNGVFALRDLPAGDYLIVALSDVEPGQWQSAKFLAELAPFAVKVSLADGEKKIQNIRIRGGYSTR